MNLAMVSFMKEENGEIRSARDTLAGGTDYYRIPMVMMTVRLNNHDKFLFCGKEAFKWGGVPKQSNITEDYSHNAPWLSSLDDLQLFCRKEWKELLLKLWSSAGKGKYKRYLWTTSAEIATELIKQSRRSNKLIPLYIYIYREEVFVSREFSLMT